MLFLKIENDRQLYGGLNKNEKNTKKSGNDNFDKLIDIGIIGPDWTSELNKIYKIKNFENWRISNNRQIKI